MWYLDSGWLLCCFCLKEHLSVTLLCLWKPVGEATHNATVGLDKHQGDCIASRHSSSRRQESGSAPEISFIFFLLFWRRLKEILHKKHILTLKRIEGLTFFRWGSGKTIDLPAEGYAGCFLLGCFCVFIFLSVFGLTLQNYKLADSELLFFLPHLAVSAWFCWWCIHWLFLILISDLGANVRMNQPDKCESPMPGS